ncbi:FAD:protein FMN transferase [uncultured Paraglaciecola sp.]|uniref:FAD:protein FMN transferase n=1 Tax=uncultured Paraglaciecola sp. TaxID=1765024 RepID=UPI0026053E20|nr:FAD:protein FMN transferase [uncultured Paraglaciecola sp.]
MASPCELLIETQDSMLANHLTSVAYTETQRIEQKFSRYQPNNLMANINHSQGKPVAIDDEAFRLLEFANSCYQLSDGMFDITSGVLRQAWKFDGSDNLPASNTVKALMPYIGWQKVQYDSSSIILAEGMELDFGGIGKEYAVDCVAKLCAEHAATTSVVVNFGGDIQVTRARHNQQPWHIGIESPGDDKHSSNILKIVSGGLATSGDARRYLLKAGKRYSHILNPETGYPIENAPRSVTIAAPHCIQAGLLATLALLQGANAEAFLEQQNVKYWCYR